MFEVYKTLLVSCLIGFIFSAMLFLTIPAKYWSYECFPQDEHARRLGGGYAGWSTTAVISHTVSDIVTFVAYCGIALTFYQKHPQVKRIKTSRFMIVMITFTFLTCGGVHLANGYCNIYPAYDMLGYFKIFAAIIGIMGSILVSHNLHYANIIWKEDNLEAESKQRRINANLGMD